jgi:ABC-2 type transport system permease protein
VVKYAVLINPLVYVAEGMRGALTPSVPHMNLGVVTAALVVIAVGGWLLGMRGFYRRAIG